MVCVCGGGLPFPVLQAKAARLNGAKIYEKVSVEGLEVSKGLGRAQCTSLRTSAGTIKAGVVVNAAGLWARVRQLWQSFLAFGYFELGGTHVSFGNIFFILATLSWVCESGHM